MRFLYMFLFLLSHQVSAGGLCDSRIRDIQSVARALTFLQTLEPYYENESCQLSINACKGFEVDSQGQFRAEFGEVLLIDKKKNKHFYVPLYEQSHDTTGAYGKILMNKRAVFYEFHDLLPTGDTRNPAVYYMELVKEPNLKKLQYIEIGLRAPGDHRIRWSICNLY